VTTGELGFEFRRAAISSPSKTRSDESDLAWNALGGSGQTWRLKRRIYLQGRGTHGRTAGSHGREGAGIFEFGAYGKFAVYAVFADASHDDGFVVKTRPELLPVFWRFGWDPGRRIPSGYRGARLTRVVTPAPHRVQAITTRI